MAAVDFSRENLSTLTRDGISDELFKLMWAKDELSFSPLLNMPDTIIYKYGQPITWYFTSADGRIKKKNKHNLISAKIEQAFNKHILGYDVIAYFITMSSDLDQTRHTDIPTVIEYFDRQSLNNFLYNHKKEVNGILQRFIEPKSTHNEIIRAIWSPKLCLLERAENKHELHDHRFGLYERCVVYEGPDYYYTSEPLRGPVLSGQIQKLLEAVVSHVAEVTFGQKQLTRIVLNFKVDSRDKIWMLYSTSIRSMDMLEYIPPVGAPRRSLVNLDSVVSLAPTVHLNPSKSYQKIIPKQRKQCLSCGNEVLEELRHSVAYKHVMRHYEHVLLLLRSLNPPSSTAKSGVRTPIASSNNSHVTTAITVPWPPNDEIIHATGGVGFGCLHLDDPDYDPTAPKRRLNTPTSIKYKRIEDIEIPPILAYLHPKLTTETYKRCRPDPLFQQKTLLVCEDCYLVYAEFATMLLRMGENMKRLMGTSTMNSPLLMPGSTDTVGSNNRPSSADWRAISTAASTSHPYPPTTAHTTHNHNHNNARGLKHEQSALDAAIGLRTSDSRVQPVFPSAIFRASTIDSQSQSQSYAGQQSPFPFQLSTAHTAAGTEGDQQKEMFKGGLMEASQATLQYDPNEVQAVIAERERRFFKEISLNPQLRDQHPLQHMLTAQNKLRLVDQQSGVLMSNAANKTESVFGTSYGKQPGDQYHKYGAYAVEVPYAISGEIVLPSRYKQRVKQQMKEKQKKKLQALRTFLSEQQAAEEEGNYADDGNHNHNHEHNTKKHGKSGGSVKTQQSTSSQQYRDFLQQSLAEVTGQVEAAQPTHKPSATAAAVLSAEDSHKLHGSKSMPAITKNDSNNNAMSRTMSLPVQPPQDATSSKVAQKLRQETEGQRHVQSAPTLGIAAVQDNDDEEAGNYDEEQEEEGEGSISALASPMMQNPGAGSVVLQGDEEEEDEDEREEQELLILPSYATGQEPAQVQEQGEPTGSDSSSIGHGTNNLDQMSIGSSRGLSLAGDNLMLIPNAASNINGSNVNGGESMLSAEREGGVNGVITTESSIVHSGSVASTHDSMRMQTDLLLNMDVPITPLAPIVAAPADDSTAIDSSAPTAEIIAKPAEITVDGEVVNETKGSEVAEPGTEEDRQIEPEQESYHQASEPDKAQESAVAPVESAKSKKETNKEVISKLE